MATFRISILVQTFLSVFTVFSINASVLEIAVQGRSCLPIVISKDASTSIQQSAKDLSDVLEKITGARSSIETSIEPRSIILGTPEQFRESGVITDFESNNILRAEDYCIHTKGGQLFILGATPLAVDRAVWDFLYRLGYRQYFPTKQWEIIPRIPDLEVDMDVVSRPDYIVRSIWYGYGTWPENMVEYRQWCRKNRLSGNSPDEFFLRSGHVYDAIIKKNQKKILADPGLLSRVGDKSTNKLNIGNPAAREMAIEYALNFLSENPASSTVSMEPSDGGGWGQSAEELAIGSPSDRAVLLANEVAVAVNKIYNQKYVGMYAYNEHSSAPEKIRLDPRVVVSFATAFIKNGLSVKEIIKSWKAAGVERFGVREYYSVSVWDRDVPSVPRASNLDYLATSISEFYKEGARFMSAESGDNWGANGLAYYFASRLLWDTNERLSKSALIEEFVSNCFPEAKVPMGTLFREILYSGRKQALNDDMIGKIFRLLKEARLLTKDEASLSRLDSLSLYGQYLIYLEKYNFTTSQKMSVEKQQEAFEDLVKFVYRIRGTGMVHGMALWRDLPIRNRVVKFAEGKTLNTPEGRNPLKVSISFTRQEIIDFQDKGITNHPERQFETTSYSGNLVPAARIPALSKNVNQITSNIVFRGENSILTWASKGDQAINFSAAGGQIYGSMGKAKIRFIRTESISIDETGPGDAPIISAEPISSTEISPDRVMKNISFLAPTDAGYTVKISDAMAGTTIIWPADEAFTLEFSESRVAAISSPYKLVFYVPKATKTIGAFATGRGTVSDPNGVKRLEMTGKAGYIAVPVPPGMDGRCWTFESSGERSSLKLLTVPPYMAPSVSQLLLPEDVVRSDSE